ncbi:MAG: ATP-binding protein [Spirosomataceae bacterium]
MKLLIVVGFFCCLPSFAQNRKAIHQLKQRVTVAQEDTAKVDLWLELAFAYAYVYQDTAIIYANQSLALSRKLHYDKGEWLSLSYLCTAMTISGNFQGALQVGFNQLAIGEKLKDPSAITDAHNNLLTCYKEQEDYKEALRHGYKAMSYAQSPNVIAYLKPLSLGFVSSVYEKINQLDSAMYYGLKASKLAENWAGIYLTLGNIYTKLDKKDTALLYYRKGIPLAQAQAINIDLIDIYNKMSIVFEHLNQKDSSIYYAQKCISQEGIKSYAEGQLRAAMQLAQLYELKGIKDSTIKYLKLSNDLRHKLFDRQKTRDAQSFAFNERIYQQQLAIQNQENEDRKKVYILLLCIIVASLTAFFLWLNNQHKQKANVILQNKNKEIQKALTELKSTQAQLIQKEKLASLGELTAGIAHEIQNPLNFVNNFSELSVELAQELQEALRHKGIEATSEEGEIVADLIQNQEKINLHGKRASNIVKGMLEHSRTSTGERQLTDINALCDEYLRLSYHGMRAKDKSFNADYKTGFDPNLPKINVIPQDIGRVLLNLINNAFYAVHRRNTAATVETLHATSLQTPMVIVSTKLIDNQILIMVKDNGPGIPTDVFPKIFQPFFTTKPTGEGTGLGLSLSYDIVVKGHDGMLEVESVEGRGGDFYGQVADFCLE